MTMILLQIFRTSSFPVDQETVKTFRNAPIISIPDANASAVKRRLSVQGIATAVSFHTIVGIQNL